MWHISVSVNNTGTSPLVEKIVKKIREARVMGNPQCSNALLNAQNWQQFKLQWIKASQTIFDDVVNLIVEDAVSITKNSLLPLRIERFEALRNTIQLTLAAKLDILKTKSWNTTKDTLSTFFKLCDARSVGREEELVKGVPGIVSAGIFEVQPKKH